MATIALLTDFGLVDGYVGMLKGVIKTIAPDCETIDISHNIESFDIRSAAFILQKSVRFFPKGTIFLNVVDPGVGGKRPIIAAKGGDYQFVAPDNGILSFVLSDFNNREVVAVENEQFYLASPSSTFHGRDIMAPVAAHLARGISLTELGCKVDSYTVIRQPNLLKHGRNVIGEIVYVDKFGNMISNIAREELPLDIELARLICRVEDEKGIRFVGSYSEADSLSAIVSGFGTVEVFLNRGRAADRFPQAVGTTIAVEVI